MNKYKIVIRGGYGLYNFGDDALIVALYQYLMNNGLSKKDVALMCVPSNYLNQQLDNPLLIDYNTIKSDISIEHLIYGGGTQFYSFDSQNARKVRDILLKNPLSIFEKIKNRIILYRRSKYVENKFNIANYASHIYQIGVGVGPFSKTDSAVENKTADLFKKSDFVSVRDVFAFNKCKDWGVTNVSQSPDLCYIMDVSAYSNKSNSIKNIAVIVRDWNHTGADKYYTQVSKFVEEYRRLGYHVQYISLDKKMDIYWMKFFKDKNEDYIQWDSDIMTFDNFYKKLSGFELVITARFHGAIFASMMGIPFITIEVEQKLRMVAENYKAGAYVWDNNFELYQLQNHITAIESNYEQHKNVIQKNSLVFKNLVTQQYNDLLKKLCQ